MRVELNEHLKNGLHIDDFSLVVYFAKSPYIREVITLQFVENNLVDFFETNDTHASVVARKLMDLPVVFTITDENNITMTRDDNELVIMEDVRRIDDHTIRANITEEGFAETLRMTYRESCPDTVLDISTSEMYGLCHLQFTLEPEQLAKLFFSTKDNVYTIPFEKITMLRYAKDELFQDKLLVFLIDHDDHALAIDWDNKKFFIKKSGEELIHIGHAEAYTGTFFGYDLALYPNDTFYSLIGCRPSII